MPSPRGSARGPPGRAPGPAGRPRAKLLRCRAVQGNQVGFESSLQQHLDTEQRRAVLEAIGGSINPDSTLGEIIDAATLTRGDTNVTRSTDTADHR